MKKNFNKNETKALKLYKFKVPKEKTHSQECENPDCEYGVNQYCYSLGENEADAKIKFAYTANGDLHIGICSGCIAEYLATSKSTILIDDVAHLVQQDILALKEQFRGPTECNICKNEFGILYKFDSTANYDCGAGICDDCLSNLLVDNEYLINPGDDLFCFKYKHIGFIQSNSDTLIIGDPMHLIHPKKPFKSLGKSWKKFVKKSDPLITNFSFKEGDPGLAISISSESTGGIFPVFAEIEDGKIKNVLIDFECNVE